MHEDLLNRGLEEWWPSDPSEQEQISGSATFQNFQQAFLVLNQRSSIEGVKFQHPWYTNWSWITTENREYLEFLQVIQDNLNDDCVRHIFKYLDVLELTYLAHISENFKMIAKEKLMHLQIFPSTVGSIGVMNFRYLLETFGESIKKISLSLNAFFAVCGFHFEFTKRNILRVIYSCCAGKNLKNIEIHDFNLTDSAMEDFDEVLKPFSEHNITVKFIS